ICRNRSLDEYRRRAANARKVEAAAAQPGKDHNCGPEVLLESLERGHAVHALLLSLSAEDRQLVALAFFRGMSHPQIAEVTDMPLGTVKSRIRRALATLERNAPATLEV
ncbi:MAG: sigma-70 family RNA polymerase sigma factor, partial [Pseudomonadota bacterium]